LTGALLKPPLATLRAGFHKAVSVAFQLFANSMIAAPSLM